MWEQPALLPEVTTKTTRAGAKKEGAQYIEHESSQNTSSPKQRHRLPQERPDVMISLNTTCNKLPGHLNC